MINMKTEQHENFVRRLQLIQHQTGWNLSEIARELLFLLRLFNNGPKVKQLHAVSALKDLRL